MVNQGWMENDGRWRPWTNHALRDIPPPGTYMPMRDMGGPFLQPFQFVSDELYQLPEPYSETVIAEIDRFWQLKEEFVKRGFVYKRGILLHGQPGAGKTALIKIITQKAVERQGAVVVTCNGNVPTTFSLVTALRQTDENIPIVAILEDIDQYIDDEADEEVELLSCLDGEQQVAGVVYIATTNNIQKLPPRLVNRPSRFDTVMEVTMPGAAARYTYLKLKEPSLTPIELENWVKVSDGLSIAHLKEMILAVKCFGQSPEAAVKRLRAMGKV